MGCNQSTQQGQWLKAFRPYTPLESIIYVYSHSCAWKIFISLPFVSLKQDFFPTLYLSSFLSQLSLCWFSDVPRPSVHIYVYVHTMHISKFSERSRLCARFFFRCGHNCTFLSVPLFSFRPVMSFPLTPQTFSVTDGGSEGRTSVSRAPAMYIEPPTPWK